jgi:SAM-dependent methyltransferase
VGDTPFGLSAHVYDIVYSHLDYPGTAQVVESIIRERNPLAQSLLDMSCGTGLHLVEWMKSFGEVEGADLDPALLGIASRRLPDIPLHVADYTDFDLGRTYDAVTCMFSAIGYAHTRERFDAAIAAMSRHLAPGGVLVIEPWLLPEMIRPPGVRGHMVETDEVVVLRSTRHRYDGDAVSGGISDMEFAYVVTTAERSEYFTERHVMGVFPPSRFVESMTASGLSAEFLTGVTELGRGLAVGVRR